MTELLGRWQLLERIDGGGFGQVYRVILADGNAAVAKLVPKDPGAERELLFVDLDGVRNVVPVIDFGETADSWVLVMPEASMSLRAHLASVGLPLETPEAVQILNDVCEALADLHGRVVHRDLKPENVLLLDGQWCLADFGISRYAEATTAPDTRKYAFTAAYAAPEQWRMEHATNATDIYAFGIIAYELLGGQRPFDGTPEELREQHLHTRPPSLSGPPLGLVAIVDECLYKPQTARPTAPNVLIRLQSAVSPPPSPGLARLQEVNRRVGAQQAARRADESRAQSAAERRSELAAAAATSFDRIASALVTPITDAAPSVTTHAANGGHVLRLGEATLKIGPMKQTPTAPWGNWEAPQFEVVAHAIIDLRTPQQRHLAYEGRSHSLWFTDAVTADNFAWYETAFMFIGLSGRSSTQAPFALDPGVEAAQALWRGMASHQIAWPFTPVTIGGMREFIDRWSNWFALAASGELQHPTQLPERQGDGGIRR